MGRGFFCWTGFLFMAGSGGYSRFLLKVSGQALMDAREYGADLDVGDQISYDIKHGVGTGTQVCPIIGSGNSLEGLSGAALGMGRTRINSAGILATDMDAPPIQINHETQCHSEFSCVEVLSQDLKVMDSSAITLARENDIRIPVFAISIDGGFRQVLAGEGTFTTIHG
jgi:uridylate kinase